MADERPSLRMTKGKTKLWPRHSRHAQRTTDHIEDPIFERVCPFCKRVHKWPLSSTQRGQLKSCSCGATFSSWRTPPWHVPGGLRKRPAGQ